MNTVVVAAIVTLGLVGFILGSEGNDVLFSEDFESEDIGFSTDDDRIIGLGVHDGMYRIQVKEPNAPSFMRHVFTHTYDGLSIEATIVHPDDIGRDAIAAIGCWAGRSAYMLATSPMGDVTLIETIDESTGERRDLTETFVAPDARNAGEPVRLRLDCVGGGREATILSAYVNGEPITSVAVEEGLDSFDAAGLFVGSAVGNVVFEADDFTVRATRPESGTSPVPPI